MTAGLAELPEFRMPVSEAVDMMRYKASLESPRGKVTGIMVIKRMPDSTFRIAYFSEVGMSYLEGSMGGHHPFPLEVRSINPLISSRKTTHILETAFNLLLMRKKDMDAGSIYEDEDSNPWIVGETSGGNQYWGRLDGEGRVEKAFLGTDRKTTAIFNYEDEAYPIEVNVHVKDKEMLTLSRK